MLRVIRWGGGWRLVAIGWLIAFGITPCAGEPSQDLSSLSVAELPASIKGFQQAARWYRQSEWEQAAHAFARCAQQASTSRQRQVALFYEAECLIQMRDYQGAHSRYDTLLNATSSAGLMSQAQFRQVQFRWGETAWLAGRPDQAEKALRQYVQQYPSDPLTARALLYLGDLAKAKNRYPQAIGCYRRILEQFPKSSHGEAARLGLGQTLLAQGEPDRAIVAVAPLTTAAEGPCEAWLLLARAYYRQGQFEESLVKIREFQARFEQSELAPRAHLVAAWALWRLGRLDRINDELAPLDSIAQWELEVQYLHGMTAYAQKKWGEAARLLSTAALSEKPAILDAILFYAGESNRRAGQPRQARKCFERLLNELPESAWARDTLRALRQLDHSGRETAADLLLEEAHCLQRDGRFDAAIAAYHALLDHLAGHRSDHPPAYPVGLWRAGRLHEKLGQFTEARSMYERLLKDCPHDPQVATALFQLGEMARRQGNLDRAAPYYRQVHTKFPQTAEAREAAYWLALRAADNKDNPAARRYMDWLLAQLSASSCESGARDSEPPHADRWLWELASEDPQEADLPGHHAHERETTRRQRQLLVHALYLQSQLAAREDKWEQVQALATQLLALVPEGELQTATQFWLAEAEFRLDHHEVARRRFQELESRVLGLDESWAPMLPLRLAQLAAERQQWTQVLQWTDKLRRDWPEFPLAYQEQYLRGRALAGRGEMSAARAAYQQVLDSSQAAGTETATMAQWMIGETYFHQHQYQRARAAYFRVIDQHSWATWQTRAALQTGKCWEIEGHWDQAEKTYADAIQRQGDTPSTKELRARLRWIQLHADSKL